MDTDKFDFEDLISDDSFIEACLNPNSKNSKFWSDWLINNPDKSDIFNQAKDFVLKLNRVQDAENNPNLELEIWKNIKSEINIEKPKSFPKKYLLLALLFVVVGLTVLLYFYTKNSSENKGDHRIVWVNFENTTTEDQLLSLSDGSSILVKPQGFVKYPQNFGTNNREVFLEGEAFFDISRDTSKAFLVYANETITKVLGTSFTIKAKKGERKVEVDVTSGKVAVLANTEKAASKSLTLMADEKIVIPKPNKKLEITANQRVVFDNKSKDLIKSVRQEPALLVDLNQLEKYEFINEPIANVFSIFEKAYGIEYDYDLEKLKDCTISTKLNNESMFKKLEIICAALNLSFEEKNAIIYIKGKGCK